MRLAIVGSRHCPGLSLEQVVEKIPINCTEIVSGGSRGAAIGHVSPEAADGGLIGLVQDGDTIHIDIPARKLELLVPEAEIEERRKHFVPVEKDVKSPFLRRYAKLVTSASTGGAYKKI